MQLANPQAFTEIANRAQDAILYHAIAKVGDITSSSPHEPRIDPLSDIQHLLDDSERRRYPSAICQRYGTEEDSGREFSCSWQVRISIFTKCDPF